MVRAEIFFDPQTHLVERNSLPLATVVNGLHRACAASPVDATLIMSFLRHRHPPLAPADEAEKILDEALANHKHQIIGVGLDSSEAGHPPRLFERVFAKARAAGLRCVAHAGEEGPASYVTDCVEIKILRRVRAELSRRLSTPSRRRLLDGVAMPVPHRSTEPGRPRHRREMT